jgi:hypothetical protein
MVMDVQALQFPDSSFDAGILNLLRKGNYPVCCIGTPTSARAGS